MTAAKPRISICIPHWQAQLYMTLCLRSIRKHSAQYDLEIIVVDNGSRDGSLDYLHSLPWIRLIERPEEQPTNWPLNVFTAWDRGLEVATGDYYLTMHSDVFVKSDNWLDPFLREISAGPHVASSGSWKLELENPLYAWQKRAIGYAVAKARSILGVGKKVHWQQQNYPRDYCALYRRETIVDHKLTFCPVNGSTGGGLSIARQLWGAGYSAGLFPVREMADCVYHIAHGTAALVPEKRLNHQRKQKQTELKLAQLLETDWIRALQIDWTLDSLEEQLPAAETVASATHDDSESLAVRLRGSLAPGQTQPLGLSVAARAQKVLQVPDELSNLNPPIENEPFAQF
jgi:glycosyltransferase involved in cell wall biosynthesis